MGNCCGNSKKRKGSSFDEDLDVKGVGPAEDNATCFGNCFRKCCIFFCKRKSDFDQDKYLRIDTVEGNETKNAEKTIKNDDP